MNSPAPAAARPTRSSGAVGPAPRPSPLARSALLAYGMLLVYGSLSPWTGWRSLGVGPLAFLAAPWPKFVTAFDLSLNVLAYFPFGLLLVLALHPRLRGWAAFAAAAALAGSLSVLLEALQTYLPARIASNLDVLTNLAGAAFGAAVGVRLAPTLIDGRQLQRARRLWIRPHAAVLLLVAALWPPAQVRPVPMLFGNGELSRDLVSTLLALLGVRLSDFDASRFAAAEALVTACGMLAAGAMLAAGLKPGAPRLRLLLVLLGAALAAKSVSYGYAFGPDRALAWLTPGAVAGLAAGALGMTAAATAAARSATVLAASSLLVLIVAVNGVAPNPYHGLAVWHPGRLRDVAAAFDWLATAWPYAALVALLWKLRGGGAATRRRSGP